MVTLNPVQWDFSGGVIGKKFRGAVDSPVYLKSLELGLNVLINSQGKIIRRPGTEKVKNPGDTNAYDTTSATGDQPNSGAPFYRLAAQTIIFDLIPTKSYRIVFTSGTIQIFDNSGSLINDNLVQTISSTGITTAVGNIIYDQGRDVIVLAHQSFGFKTLRRNADATWTLANLEIEDGPYENLNIDKNIRLKPNHPDGTGKTLHAIDKSNTSVNNFFSSADIGRLFRLRHSPASGKTTFGVCKVTATVSPFHTATVDIPIEYELGGTDAIKNWYKGAWYSTQFPQVLKFARNRLWAAFNDRIFGSFADDFNRFSPTTENIFDDKDGHLVTDACGIDTRITNLKGERIYWIHEDEVIHIGGSNGYYTLRGSTLLGPITPSTITLNEQSGMGCADVKPISLGSLIFVHKSGKKVFAAERNFRTDRYEVVDLNQYADDIFDAPIVKIVKTTYPYPVAWFILDNGSMVSLTYIKATETVAWSRHTLASGQIEDAAVMQDSDGNERIYFIVKNGNEYFVEKMSPLEQAKDSPFIDQTSFLTDGSFTRSGLSGSTTLNNLQRFNGKTLYAIHNQRVLTSGVISSGSVTLTIPSGYTDTIEFGIAPEISFTTLPIEAKSNEQSTIGETKQGITVSLGLFNTGHLEVRQKGLTEWTECVPRENTSPTGTEEPLFTGTTDQLKIPGERTIDLQYEFRQRLPSPLGVSHIGVKMNVSSV